MAPVASTSGHWVHFFPCLMPWASFMWVCSDLASFTTMLHLRHFWFTTSIYQTLRICIQVQFSQRYGQIKDRRPNLFLNIFGLAWPWDPRGPGTYSKFVQNTLMIDLWMEDLKWECPYFYSRFYFEDFRSIFTKVKNGFFIVIPKSDLNGLGYIFGRNFFLKNPNFLKFV